MRRLLTAAAALGAALIGTVRDPGILLLPMPRRDARADPEPERLWGHKAASDYLARRSLPAGCTSTLRKGMRAANIRCRRA
jgi:hypothetical protein